jgi:hypothetical protein
MRLDRAFNLTPGFGLELDAGLTILIIIITKQNLVGYQRDCR